MQGATDATVVCIPNQAESAPQQPASIVCCHLQFFENDVSNHLFLGRHTDCTEKPVETDPIFGQIDLTSKVSRMSLMNTGRETCLARVGTHHSVLMCLLMKADFAVTVSGPGNLATILVARLIRGIRPAGNPVHR